MLNEMRRQLQAQKLRQYLLATDAKTQQQAVQSQAIREKNRIVREGNRRAADAMGFAVGDQAVIHRTGHPKDGVTGTVERFRDLPTGKRLAVLVIEQERFISKVPLPPIRISCEVDVEALRRAA